MYRFNKDSGWAWIVCCGSSIAFLLETGIVKALGLLLPELQQQFSTHTWVIGLIISLVPGFGAIACIFSGALSNIYSPRVAMMMYGLLSSIGLIVGSLAETIPQLVIAVLLTSFSFGAESITTAALPLYFDTFFDMVNGLTHAGISIGLMILPPLTRVLLDTYGWRGTLLILESLNLHLVACGALLRPLEISNTNCVKQSTNEVSQKHLSSFTTRLVDKLKKMFQCVDFDLLSRIDFLTLLCTVTTSGYSFTGWVIYFVPHCEALGFLPFDCTLLATIGGIGYLVGTIAFAIAAKCVSAKLIFYISAISMAMGLATDSFMSIVYSCVGIMVSSFVANFGFATNFCCLFKEIVVIVEEEKLSIAVSWIFVGYAIGSISSGFLSGWLYDSFGNYVTSFLFLSIVSAFLVIPWFALDIRRAVIKVRRGDYSIIEDTKIKPDNN